MKDLRTLCRANGLNPGGGKEALVERVCESMQGMQLAAPDQVSAWQLRFRV